MFPGRTTPIDENELTVIIGLVARCRHLSTELARSRDSDRITSLSATLDGHRWELLMKHGVEIKTWQGKPQPLSPASA